MFRFSGIFRSVHLIAEPAIHLADLAVYRWRIRKCDAYWRTATAEKNRAFINGRRPRGRRRR
jgi:beta-galactosidase/beta-glucuronidase